MSSRRNNEKYDKNINTYVCIKFLKKIDGKICMHFSKDEYVYNSRLEGGGIGDLLR